MPATTRLRRIRWTLLQWPLLLALVLTTPLLGCGAGGGGGSSMGIQVCNDVSSSRAIMRVQILETGSGSPGPTTDVDLSAGECHNFSEATGIYDVIVTWSDAVPETRFGVVVLTGFTQVTFTR